MNFKTLFKDLESSLDLALMLHHCWQKHPLKVVTTYTVFKLSDTLALDVAAIESVKTLPPMGDLMLTMHNGNTYMFLVDSPEYLVFHKFLSGLSHISSQIVEES